MTEDDRKSEEAWRDILTKPHWSPFAWLPSDPRCSMCRVPFGGIGGRISSLVGQRPWNKNPSLCNRCYRSMPSGGVELDIAVFLADIRGSTALGERLGPTSFARLLNQFYSMATRVLIP